MPKFFFHTPDGRALPDEGGELPGSVAARDEAMRLLGEMIRATPADLRPAETVRLIVTDETGAVVYSLDLSEHRPPPDHLRLVRDE